ncbi:MAG TPA: DUF2934 domain-containing protein [Verrucomicrobiae bacterium]|nr:DUF2934 domain-containing protein [Verrucomicrobiae bacterium]
MSKNSKVYRVPTHAEISACAHLIYEREGRPEGKANEHWLQAEAQLIAERKAEAGVPVAKAAPALPAAGKPRAAIPATSGAPNAQWAASSRQNLRGN